jgi:hypothetical protein
MKRLKLLLLWGTTLMSLGLAATSARASTFTLASPSSQGSVPSGISSVGGIVLDLVGQNNTRVTSQLAASQLFTGFYNSGSPSSFNGNPGTIGIQNGFDAAVTAALGGGIKEAAVRFTLFDGDTGAGDFDQGNNTLLLNGISFGNWSSVNAENTDSAGNSDSGGFSAGGFRDQTLDTGWFYTTDTGALGSFFSSLTTTSQVVYQVADVDPFDNFYDFTRGIDASLINVGQGPVVVAPGSGTEVPEPLSVLGAAVAAAFGGNWVRRRKQLQMAKATVDVD